MVYFDLRGETEVEHKRKGRYFIECKRIFKFADKTQQLIRANGFSLLVMWMVYLRNRKTAKMRYISLAGTCLVSWIICLLLVQLFY